MSKDEPAAVAEVEKLDETIRVLNQQLSTEADTFAEYIDKKQFLYERIEEDFEIESSNVAADFLSRFTDIKSDISSDGSLANRREKVKELNNQENVLIDLIADAKDGNDSLDQEELFALKEALLELKEEIKVDRKEALKSIGSERSSQIGENLTRRLESGFDSVVGAMSGLASEFPPLQFVIDQTGALIKWFVGELWRALAVNVNEWRKRRKDVKKAKKTAAEQARDQRTSAAQPRETRRESKKKTEVHLSKKSVNEIKKTSNADKMSTRIANIGFAALLANKLGKRGKKDEKEKKSGLMNLLRIGLVVTAVGKLGGMLIGAIGAVSAVLAGPVIGAITGIGSAIVAGVAALGLRLVGLFKGLSGIISKSFSAVKAGAGKVIGKAKAALSKTAPKSASKVANTKPKNTPKVTSSAQRAGKAAQKASKASKIVDLAKAKPTMGAKILSGAKSVVPKILGKVALPLAAGLALYEGYNRAAETEGSIADKAKGFLKGSASSLTLGASDMMFSDGPDIAPEPKIADGPDTSVTPKLSPETIDPEPAPALSPETIDPLNDKVVIPKSVESTDVSVVDKSSKLERETSTKETSMIPSSISKTIERSETEKKVNEFLDKETIQESKEKETERSFDEMFMEMQNKGIKSPDDITFISPPRQIDVYAENVIVAPKTIQPARSKSSEERIRTANIVKAPVVSTADSKSAKTQINNNVTNVVGGGSKGGGSPSHNLDPKNLDASKINRTRSSYLG